MVKCHSPRTSTAFPRDPSFKRVWAGCRMSIPAGEGSNGPVPYGARWVHGNTLVTMLDRPRTSTPPGIGMPIRTLGMPKTKNDWGVKPRPHSLGISRLAAFGGLCRFIKGIETSSSLGGVDVSNDKLRLLSSIYASPETDCGPGKFPNLYFKLRQSMIVIGAKFRPSSLTFLDCMSLALLARPVVHIGCSVSISLNFIKLMLTSAYLSPRFPDSSMARG